MNPALAEMGKVADLPMLLRTAGLDPTNPRSVGKYMKRLRAQGKSLPGNMLPYLLSSETMAERVAKIVQTLNAMPDVDPEQIDKESEGASHRQHQQQDPRGRVLTAEEEANALGRRRPVLLGTPPVPLPAELRLALVRVLKGLCIVFPDVIMMIDVSVMLESGLPRKVLWANAEKMAHFLFHRQAKDSTVPRKGLK